MFFSSYKARYRNIFSVIALVILLGAGALVAYFVRYSATASSVCKQCHPELINLWENSNGHPAEQTKCYECHSKNFRLLPQDWNIFRHLRDQWVPPKYIADDEATSQRCLDCHENILFFGYVVQKKLINFNHRIHLGERLECVDCHRTAGHEYMTAGSNRPTVYACINCHYKEFEGPPKNQKCLNCHDVMLAPGRSW